jgi:hypothetical protein
MDHQHHVKQIRNLLGLSFLFSLLFWPRYDLVVPTSTSLEDPDVLERNFLTLSACRSAGRIYGRLEYLCIEQTAWDSLLSDKRHLPEP